MVCGRWRLDPAKLNILFDAKAKQVPKMDVLTRFAGLNRNIGHVANNGLVPCTFGAKSELLSIFGLRGFGKT